VARVQYLAGEVSVSSGGTDHWTAAVLNSALSSNTHVWTDKNSWAELNVGGAFIRMNSETSLTLMYLSRSTVQLQVNQGTASLTVEGLLPGEIYEVDTLNGALTVMKSGVYTVGVNPTAGQTQVTVRQGSITATGQGSAVTVNSNQQVLFVNGYTLQHTAQKAPAPDGFEDWVNVRNQRLGIPRHGPYFAVGVGGFAPWGMVAVGGPVVPPPMYPPLAWPYPYPH
jgi:ferric-dicitrate binding protein FerR (iron transport regulator)